ncbi:ubiquitin carboxyl-terminal hydrolase [Diaporthe helianthi]|uniref:Ubiquitin carboxyl-terminal hydrolase n=1 Tax=Diaporthe helianthi TaxID=158607 RepID=A0A2P5IG61_DIAHE|nr:ubiquitin carboxyl-terminal hydrolase [Diaporthe helianthi]
MAGFMKKLRSASTGASTATKDPTLKSKKDEPPQELTPLEKMLQNAGPVRSDGSDKFFGLENFGNTCYCNSIVQALYYCETFRTNVVSYPPHTPVGTPNGQTSQVKVTIRPPMNGNATNPANKQKPLTAAQAMKQRQQIGTGQLPSGQQKPEDRPDSPEYKKKQAMIKGPVLELAQDNTEAYGMEECTFTGLKDIFTALIESNTRTGVLSPQRFLEIFKRDNENFRNQNHQDAHEFYGLVLNDVISSVEANATRLQELEATNANGYANSVGNAVGASAALMKAQQAMGTTSPGTGWVHDIFEGVLTSETKCLSCETTSQRDETFLDLSIDLEEHSSVTACLRKFSDEEMLCERNKFHCDQCGGLQEAEKRMKIKKLPKVLALHLKRFKYTEDFTRLQKLFHRVVYPYHLRMFNTTDEAEDPDRLYELYAVVVHIGGNAYHGHYVSIIKTPDRGWLLFDDEMVEPVDKHFVRNFFGDKPGMACAYVLFYQETTHEKVMAEQEAEGLEEVRLEREKADLALERVKTNGELKSPLVRQLTTPLLPIDDKDNFAALDHAMTAPGIFDHAPPVPPIPEHVPEPIQTHPLNAAPPQAPSVEPKTPVSATPHSEDAQTPKDKKIEKKELKAAEKARKVAEKEAAKEEEKRRKENAKRLIEARRANDEELQKALAESKAAAAEDEKKRKQEAKDVVASSPITSASASPKFLSRGHKGSKSLSRKSMGWLAGSSKDRDKDKDKDKNKDDKVSEGGEVNGSEARSSSTVDRPERHALKERFSISGIGRKKSNVFS